jgi:hypothetical protein
MRWFVVVLLGGCNAILGLGETREIDAAVPPAHDAPTKYTEAVLADHPIAYFRLDETSGVDVHDLVGGTPGVIVGNVTLGAASALLGDHDPAMGFDGMNSAIDLDQRFGFEGQAPYSIECWVSPELDGKSRSIMSKWQQPPMSQGWDLYYEDTRIVVTRETQAGSDALFTDAILGDNAYHHIVATYDGAMLAMYLDGRRENTVAATYVLPNIPQNMLIGAGNGNPAQQDQDMKGRIDEVAFYDHALMPDRVKAHFDAGQH